MMNRSKIEWCDHTWNPITGCRHGCTYCYARTMTSRFAGDVRLNKMAKADYQLVDAEDGSEAVYRLEKPMMNETGNALVYPFGFEPTYHRYRMDTLDKLKMGNNIFVGAMADVFGAWVPEEWIRDIIGVCENRPQHNYVFLTKNPKRYNEVGVPLVSNMWYGTSITRESEMRRIKYLPLHKNTFISFEPLLEDVFPELYGYILKRLGWIIIGAQTGRRKDKVVPDTEWINKLVRQADIAKIPVFMKDSLIPIVGEQSMRREFPEQLQRSTMSPKMEAKTYDICAECKVRLKKRDMVTLLARSRRGEQPKQFGFMCRECFKKFCGGLGLNIPLLSEFADSITIGSGDADK